MVDEGRLLFPEGPRAKLDTALNDLVAKATDVLETQGRLRALLRANQLITQQLDLPVVLRRIVETAIELVHARYGALGVIAADGSLEQFIHVGMSEDEVRSIGHLPEGHGLLGALIANPHPIRLPHLSDDQRSSGFPANHPGMESFLGVPIRVRDQVFGNLYLTDAATGEFTADDEELVMALASTAGFAIDNARLFDQARRRQTWLAASAELTVAVTEAAEDPLGLVVARVFELSSADLVRVSLPTEDPAEMVIARAKGVEQDSMVGIRFATKGSVSGRVLQLKRPLLISEEHVPGVSKSFGLGPTLAVPLVTAGTITGVLAVSRLPGGESFHSEDLDMVADLAGRVGIAMELAAARADRQQIALMEERERIAQDLHDHVIQQLFSTGLELQSLAGTAPSGLWSARLEAAVSKIDQSIAKIRTAVFALSTSGEHSAIRHRIMDLVGELGDSLAQKPWVSFEGPIDLVIVDGLAEDVLAVIREALTNIAKHAEATRASLVVAIRNSMVEIEVENDGSAPISSRLSGLANLRSRATRRGGDFDFTSDDGSTVLRWRAPIEQTGETDHE